MWWTIYRFADWLRVKATPHLAGTWGLVACEELRYRELKRERDALAAHIGKRLSDLSDPNAIMGGTYVNSHPFGR